MKCGGVRAAWADELTHTTHPSQFRLSNWQDPTRPQLPARSPLALSDLVGGFFGHHRNFACPESPASRAEDDLGGEHGLLREIESVFRLPVDCGPARIFGGLRGDHSEAATRIIIIIIIEGLSLLQEHTSDHRIQYQ